ncbi:MAG: tetratricopeptide repeat protein [Gemmatales bacterium]
MPRIAFAIALSLIGFTVAQAYEDRPPLVEQYLHSGQLQAGEHALQAALRKNPKDDEARFGLGLLQIVRGVERLGQSFYDHGLKSTNNWVPFVRLPVPTNPDPAPISYARFRRILDDFCKDMMQADATLAGITDETVKLRVRLAGIKIDLDGDGQATDRFLDILTKLMGSPPDLLRSNPEFRVHFDRGDVAWFRTIVTCSAACWSSISPSIQNPNSTSSPRSCFLESGRSCPNRKRSCFGTSR